MKQKILITGGSGLLGSTMARVAQKGFHTFATYHQHPLNIPGCQCVPLDITNFERVASTMETINPEIVFHTAALAKVDYCETHSIEAWATNVEGTDNLARATERTGAKLVYISTDSVFNGEKGKYVEEDVTHPLNVYASTKLEGEKKVIHYAPRSIVVRTAFYGWSRHGGSGFAESTVTALREGKTLNMLTDVFFSPILTDNLAEILLELGTSDSTGIFHLGAPEKCSQYQFGLELASKFGFRRELVQPATLAESRLTGRRAKDLSLDSSKVRGSIVTPILGVRDGISRFKELGDTIYSCTR